MNYLYVKNHRKRVREDVIEAHGGKCTICGYDRCIRSLHFHHLDPSTKSFTIGKNTRISARNKIYEESKKCILVCSNCHGEIHDGLIDLTGVYSSARLEQLSDTQEVGGSNPPTPTCSRCGNATSDKRFALCRDCSDKERFRIDWPEKDTLRSMVDELGYSAVGRQLGCSDNAVRKRLR